MKIEEFKLERIQSLWENRVRYNLTESGIHPYTLRELLKPEEIDRLLDVRLGYGWTNGEPNLRERIAGYYAHTSPANVLVTNGSAEANFLSMWTLLEPGDEILLMVPNYMQIWGIAGSLGVRIKTFSLLEDRDWAPDIEEIRTKTGPKTKLIVLCNPNNPTGAVLDEETMRAIVDIASQTGARIFADEVYKGVELNGREGSSFRDLDDRAVVTSGLSKALAHPGLRIGWLVGPEDFIADAWLRNDYTTITTSILSELIACQILLPERRDAILERNRSMLRKNLDMVTQWAGRNMGRFTFVPPRAGGMLFMRYAAAFNSTRFSEWLRKEKGLLILPGDVYAMDRYLRIGIGERAEYLRAGLALLEEGYETYEDLRRPSPGHISDLSG